jgi:hypothetical protein
MDQMETKVQELRQETLPPAPESATATDRPVAEDDRRTVAEVLARQIRSLQRGD